MSRVLRIADVCRQLGRSADCIRDWVRRGILPATRTPSGQLQFDIRDVRAIKRGDLASTLETSPRVSKTSAAEPSQPPTPELPRPRWEEIAPWDQEVHQARASVEVERLNAELAKAQTERQVTKQLLDRAVAEEAAAQVERERLTRLKQNARMYSFIPPEIQPRVTSEIDRFVTSEQVPAWLPAHQQTEVVMDHVRGLVKVWSQEQTTKMLATIDEQREKRRREQEQARQKWERSREQARDRREQVEAEQLRAAQETRVAERARHRAEREGLGPRFA